VEDAPAFSSFQRACCRVLTRVLRDLPLGNHLFALGIHQLAVLVLLQALEDVPGICFSAETLQESFPQTINDQTTRGVFFIFYSY